MFLTYSTNVSLILEAGPALLKVYNDILLFADSGSGATISLPS